LGELLDMYILMEHLFFLFVFVHMFRGLFYFSYLKPRYQVWNVGIIIFLLMIITAFTGYVLPWGQMSFWAATVITNLFSAVPVFGDYITVWLWGSYSVSGSTLNRFFTFHFILPFIILLFVLIHFLFLHEVGSTNNLLFNKKYDKILFHPFYTFKDFFIVFLFFLFFFIFIGFLPNYLSHSDNYIQADSLVTPAHIVPEWYFSLFYAMLRSIPSKLGGIIVLLLSIVILFIFPVFIRIFFFKYLWLNEKFENLVTSDKFVKLMWTPEIFVTVYFNWSHWRKIILQSNTQIILFIFFCSLF